VNHLKGLKMRGDGEQVGFDAFATIVVDCDNVGPCHLFTAGPSPQAGETHHYAMFIKRVTDAYAARFG